MQNICARRCDCVHCQELVKECDEWKRKAEEYLTLIRRKTAAELAGAHVEGLRSEIDALAVQNGELRKALEYAKDKVRDQEDYEGIPIVPEPTQAEKVVAAMEAICVQAKEHHGLCHYTDLKLARALENLVAVKKEAGLEQ